MHAVMTYHCKPLTNLTLEHACSTVAPSRRSRFGGVRRWLALAAATSAAACADVAPAETAAPRDVVEVLAQEQATATFPRTDEEVNVTRAGPYKFERYTQGLNNRAYNSAVMYYPVDAKPPFAAVAFSPGFTATKEQYQDFLGPLLASHGIAIMLTTPTSTSDQPQARSADLQAALETIRAENTRAGSPLQGKVAVDRMCITGHSMGGGGTLWAANTLGDKIKCAVPLQPWQPGQSFNRVAAPTLFITAQNDTVAGNASNSLTHYRSIPATVPKYYVEFARASHFLTSNSRGSNYEGQSRYMIAFYKAYLEDDKRYLEFLTTKLPELSRLDHAP